MIARIIMSEHPDERDLEPFFRNHREAVRYGFLTNAEISVSIQTGPTSMFVITGYQNQESANFNLEARQKWFDEIKINILIPSTMKKTSVQ
jgi:hypothetical protein